VTGVDSGPGVRLLRRVDEADRGEPVPVPLRRDLTIDPAAIEAAITDDTVAFVVNSPGNPTGAVSSEEDVREFARIADEHDVLCISDEVYRYTVFEGNTTRRWSSPRPTTSS